MARPDFTDIAPRISLNPGALSGAAGNPDLDPYRANQADMSLEFYPEREYGVRARVVLQGREVVHHRQPGDAELHRSRRQTAPNLQCTNDRHRTSSTARSPSTSAPTAAAADQGRGARGDAADLGRLWCPDELHVLGCRGGQRRPAAGQLEESVQPQRLLRESLGERASVVHLPLGVLRDVRPSRRR